VVELGKMSLEELREKAKKIKIIFFDIDDTLRLKNEQYMPESVQTAFKELKEKNYITGIATGRGPLGIVPEVKNLNPDYFVTINGQFVINGNDKEVYRNPLPNDVVEKIIAWAGEIGIEYAFIGSYHFAISQWNQYASDATEIVYGVIPEDKDFYKNHGVYQMLTIEDGTKNPVLPEELQQYVRLVRWHKYSNDIIPLHGSKANGIKQVIEQLGIAPDEVMAFGDELNVVEMFNYVGLAVAMGNANEKIKGLSDFVTKPVEEDGIYYALKELGIL
jgi:peptidyl-prolyl cis-trans isomerase B (cyclophilin B)